MTTSFLIYCQSRNMGCNGTTLLVSVIAVMLAPQNLLIYCPFQDMGQNWTTGPSLGDSRNARPETRSFIALSYFVEYMGWNLTICACTSIELVQSRRTRVTGDFMRRMTRVTWVTQATNYSGE